MRRRDCGLAVRCAAASWPRRKLATWCRAAPSLGNLTKTV